MRGRGISFHGPVNSGEAGDTDLNPKLCWPYLPISLRIGSYPHIDMKKITPNTYIHYFALLHLTSSVINHFLMGSTSNSK